MDIDLDPPFDGDGVLLSGQGMIDRTIRRAHDGAGLACDATEGGNMYSQRYSTWIISPLARSNRVTGETKQTARDDKSVQLKEKRTSRRFVSSDSHRLRYA